MTRVIQHSWLAAVLVGLLLARLPLEWAVGLVGGTAVLLLVLIHPLFGVAFMLLVGPLSALENILFGSSALDAGQFMLLLTTAVWLARGCLRRRIILPHTFLNLPLSLFLFVATFTLLDAASLEFGFKELLKWAEIGLLVVMVTDLTGGSVLSTQYSVIGDQYSVSGEKKTGYWILNTGYWLVLAMLLLAGFSQALIGIWQFTLAGTGPENEILGHFYLASEFFGQRVYGTFEQPNPFGGFMNLTALLAAGAFLGYLVAWWRGARGEGRGAKGEGRGMGVSSLTIDNLQLTIDHFIPLLLLAGVVIAATAALLFSLSRGAWLGFGAGAAVLVLFWPKKQWHGVGLVALAVVGLLLGLQLGLVPASIADRLSGFQEDFTFGDVRGVDINDDNYAVLERLAHWQAALDMAREQPWLGVGFGNYEPAYPRFALINWPFPLGHAHNYYLNLLAEIGVIGFVAYGVLWTAVFWQTIQLLRYLDWPHRGVVLGLLAAWVALAVHHLVDKLYVNNIYLHLGVMLALLQLLKTADNRRLIVGEPTRVYTQ